MILTLLIASGCYDPARIIITNDLESNNIEHVYVSSSSDDEWGVNSLPDWKVLMPGESVDITVLPDTYDIQIVDENGNTYTRWELEIGNDDCTWNVSLDDLD